jgi:pimeloyl-ACP methyl ester carboxylesterase
LGDPVIVLGIAPEHSRIFRHPPQGQLVEAGGRRFHVDMRGDGGPPVIMEAAIGDFSLTWALVHPAVAQFTRSIVYDRLGLGWSDPGPEPRDAQTAVNELRRLLETVGVRGPYILVGQSYSGLLARLFAYQHPEEVAGMVLVDSAHEDQFDRFPRPIREAFGPLKKMQFEALSGIAQTVASQGPEAAAPILIAPAGFPPDLAKVYGEMSVADPSRIHTFLAELDALEKSQAQVREARPAGLGDIPVAVLSHGQPQIVPGMPEEVNRAYEEAWQEMQIELAGLSRRSRRIVVEESGHMIHHEQPQVIVDTIREMILVAA